MPISLESPYPKQWRFALKGNLHTHTTVSDGIRTMQQAVDEYASRGYGFLMISDHDRFEDISVLDPKGMVLIPGVEVSGGGPHMLQVGLGKVFPPDPDRQKIINAVNAEGGFVVANHPNWQGHFNHFPQELLEALEGYAGIEIYNGVITRLPGSPLATDRWDRLLTAGRRLRGFGTDDSHKENDVAIAWTVVFVDERTPEAVLAALRSGACYASTGVTISDIRTFGNSIHVKAPDADRMVVVSDGGTVVAQKWSNEITFEVTPVIETYVRIECYGRGGLAAWTQPFFVQGTPGTGERCEASVPIVAAGPGMGDAFAGRGWQGAVELSGFLDISTGKAALAGTSVRLLADGERLYAAFYCKEQFPDGMVFKGGHGQMTRLYTDDSVEVFLDPGGRGLPYFHLIMNAKGEWGGAVKLGEKWDPRLEAAAGEWEEGWAVAVAIPLASLGVDEVKDGTEWRANFCRNRLAGKRETSSWAWTGKDFHRPGRFGLLRFRKA